MRPVPKSDNLYTLSLFASKLRQNVKKFLGVPPGLADAQLNYVKPYTRDWQDGQMPRSCPGRVVSRAQLEVTHARSQSAPADA